MVVDMVYSENLGTMVVKGFTLKRVYIDITGKNPYFIKGCKHYTWDDDDLVYYNDDVDDDFFFDIPCNGLKRSTLLTSYCMRYLIIKDK